MNDNSCTKGIFPGDIIIKNAIELAIDDMRKNPYIIDDVFASLIENPLLNKKYGIKEVSRAREFILNNKIHYFMAGRVDKEAFPCITISIGSSREDDSLATLGDNTDIVEELDPSEIGKKITYIIPPFIPDKYDKETGIITAPEGLEGYELVRGSMVAIDPETGAGFIITGKSPNNGIQIAAGSDLTGSKVAIVPEYHVYITRRERATSKEVYNIGCHTHGDPSTAIFLFSVVKYCLYRYRESLLEHENFQLTSIQASEFIKNQAFDIENVYSRFITLTGQCEETWLKTPYRIIEAITLDDVVPESGLPGIKILGEKAPDTIIPECEPWITIEDDEK